MRLRRLLNVRRGLCLAVRVGSEEGRSLLDDSDALKPPVFGGVRVRAKGDT